MELVYLWVEDYKNIHRQGFNFSPKFTCDYNKNTNELTIDKNDNYIENFFGDNINVTAIVGKNGSGKSSISKLILMLIYYQKFVCLDRGDKFIDPENFDRTSYRCKRKIESIFQNKKIFLILDNKGVFEKISISSNFKSNKKINTFNDIYFFTFHLNYMLDTLNDGYHDNWVNEIYHKQDNYKTPLLIQPNKYDHNSLKEMIDLNRIDFINTQRLLLLYKDINNNQKITSFFNPNYLKIGTLFTQFLFNGATPDSIDLNYMRKIINKLNLLLVKYQKEIDITNGENNKLHPLLKEIDENKNYKYMNLLYLVFKILTVDENIFDEEVYKELEKLVIDALSQSEIPTENDLNKLDFDKIIKDDIGKNDYRAKKIRISIEFDKNQIYNDKNFKLLLDDKEVLIDDLQDILEYLPTWIDIVFNENGKSFNSLSSGEKSIFRMLIDIIYQIEKIKVHYSTINVMLDETELGLHPQWQKEYLKNIIETISLYVNKKLNVNILCTTHSPFLLSDLPKENVIFLDTYDEEKTESKYPKLDSKDLDNGDCINVSKYININPFGANIHTLLSDGFFMDEGLMGEFAKGKINKIIRFLNGKNRFIDFPIEQIEKVINTIGEPFLKEKLSKMYFDKFDTKKQNRIKELKAEIKRLEND